MAGLIPPDDVDFEHLDQGQLVARLEAARIRPEELDAEGLQALDDLLAGAPERFAEWGILPTVVGSEG